jgi:hypothetical protein
MGLVNSNASLAQTPLPRDLTDFSLEGLMNVWVISISGMQ